MSNVARQPKGIREGGQFADSKNPEASVDLAADVANWGDVTNVQGGSRTPWGIADYVSHPAPGIVTVSTPGHGGVKLSPERNRAIPTALRRASGWYEEDCEANIVGLYHPEAFPWSLTGANPSKDVREQSRQGVIEWFPDGYEAAFGATLPIGASGVKDQTTWYELHANDEVALSASGDWRDDVPEGMVAVTVTRGGNRTEKDRAAQREILVPKSDYDSPEFRHPLGRHAGSFVADPSKNYLDVTAPPKAPNPPAPRFRDVDTSGLSVDAAYRANRELGRQYRFSGGEAKSLADHIADGALIGKGHHLARYRNDGRNKCALRFASEAEGEPGRDNYFTVDVSKATFDAVQAPVQEHG
jgi:uncharacterized protein YdaT